ncbi:MAG: polymer-forming cytoskeletal protein [Candidatus Aminicenantes bacterium]|nr:polymer-forming cytoskeletal protein [Candidatus Aminicenantes bacterium]
MFGRDKKDESGKTRNDAAPASAVLGRGHFFKGEITGEEDLTVMGYIKGRIDLKNNVLTVEKGGRVDGDIVVNELILFGSVNGNVYASSRVFVAAEALMRGDITAARISISDGAVFKGSIKMEDSLEKVFPAKEKSESKPAKEKSKPKKEEGDSLIS